MNEPPADPPLQDRQFRLQTAWGLLTACAITFAIVRSLRELYELSLVDWALLTAYSGLILVCLRKLLRSIAPIAPWMLAWFGTGAAGMIFGTFTGYITMFYNPVTMVLGSFVGLIVALLFGGIGLNLGLLATHVLNTESSLVLGLACGGSTGFMAVAIPMGLSKGSFQQDLALAAAWLGTVVATYAVAVGKRTARRNNSAAIPISPSEPEPAPEPDPLRPSP